ncbi:ABC transporter ATP-binding protein [Ralstonia mannitolilytica]|uniref:Bicarbonate transport ATP-binding protein CmpD n=1 Tax=Ralstonia mannitolilytica TaxID=105219 RepID=A0AAJ4ZNT4_9RALS|nr:ABC transporter ATP-binding protein [Ralstonia mannitolilytica]CAG2130352.1 Vitamin B12 import ATP-binding protein BtuD [Ralstonia mannitolilytica]CAJ0735555.1 Vitamin B12 import ATP-binding protein BtuD [Ralstonia mannitolilytica]SUE24570.1 Bicarbonate transport ATP-binding protein CmpD [Ralstonia mannitolilytica]SUE25526.1 Bicarbonate transport ATP-binding protein CmpD [Ralstonia mannitolilytica]SUE35335.1 Bicarbonate transport ATP-binding protein CmpD [Ralstonia mannitolilytica]
MSSKIVARGVRMDYSVRNDAGQREDVAVLRDFDLDIRDGEFLSVLGPSGCGKSTFLSILAGLTDRTGGSIRIDGQPLTGINPQQGVVFQGYALFPWRTVLENIEVGLEIRGVPKAERRRIAQEHLELVGLTGAGARYPHEISGGMKQRVAIARSLAYKPDVLLMDEPFAALDAQTREILQGELLRIWEQYRKTIVFITHSLDEAIFLSDRIAVMTRRPGTVKQILEVPLPRPRLPELRNSEAFVALRQQAWDILKDEVQFANPGAAPRPLGATADPRERAEGEAVLHAAGHDVRGQIAVAGPAR